MDTSDLAKRMKDYESVSKTRLMKRCPVICRIDGKAHHSFTKGFKKPFDEIYMKSMQETAKYLCENIQGVVMSYQQSDEITLVIIDYMKLNTSPYFDYEVQKLCSIIASMATMAFNKSFSTLVEQYEHECSEKNCHSDESEKYLRTLLAAIDKGAMFDARVFNIPKEEVTNLIYWRQLDATRNSIQIVGQAYFSHNELQDKTCNMIQDMLMTKYGINWNDFTTPCKRGTACIRVGKKVTENIKREPQPFGEDRVTTTIIEERPIWVIDKNMPILKGEDRKYVDNLIYIGEE